MTPSEIKSGMKFGHWTVLKYDHTNKHRIKYFLCECDCGTKRAIRGTSLINGESTACSSACNNNIIGQRFGKWKVLKKDKSRKGYYWCKCECGTVKSVYQGSLKTGKSKSCGCKKTYHLGTKPETIEKYKKYIGNSYDYLTIIDIDKNGNFVCKCVCGKICTVSRSNLLNNKHYVISCGCKGHDFYLQEQKQKYNNYIGQHINNLLILNCFYKNNSFWYNCKCDCGKELVIQATKVVNNYIQSCGCIKSKAEEQMSKILEKYYIPFKREYKFQDCRDKMPLPFNFALFNNEDELLGLIELNGKQHYTIGGWQTKERLVYTQKHDKIKLRFCEQNNIPFLIIPYQYYDELEKFLITSDFWQIITKNFND